MISFKKSFIIITAISFILYHGCDCYEDCKEKLLQDGFIHKESGIKNFILKINFWNEIINPGVSEFSKRYFAYIEDTIYYNIMSIENTLTSITDWCIFWHNRYNVQVEDCNSYLKHDGFIFDNVINNFIQVLSGNKTERDLFYDCSQAYFDHLQNQLQKFNLYGTDLWCSELNKLNENQEMFKNLTATHDQFKSKINVISVPGWCKYKRTKTKFPINFDYCNKILTNVGFRGHTNDSQINYGILVIKYDKKCNGIEKALDNEFFLELQEVYNINETQIKDLANEFCLELKNSYNESKRLLI